MTGICGRAGLAVCVCVSNSYLGLWLIMFTCGIALSREPSHIVPHIYGGGTGRKLQRVSCVLHALVCPGDTTAEHLLVVHEEEVVVVVVVVC